MSLASDRSRAPVPLHPELDPAASGVRPALAALLEQRYAEPAATEAPGGIELDALPALAQLLSHRSVRRYLPDALPDGTLELLVAAAQSASSSSNLQLWSVIDVRDPARRQALSEVAGGQAHIRDAPAFLVWVAEEGGWSTHSSQRIASVAALRGRDRLRHALHALGFELY